MNLEHIMSKNIVTIQLDTPMDEVVNILVDKNLTGLPVIDDENKLLGIITEKDVLKMLFSSKETSVADLMTKQLTTIEENIVWVQACELLVNSNFRRIPVVRDGKLVGIVTRRDFVKFLKETKHLKGKYHMLDGVYYLAPHLRN